MEVSKLKFLKGEKITALAKVGTPLLSLGCTLRHNNHQLSLKVKTGNNDTLPFLFAFLLLMKNPFVYISDGKRWFGRCFTAFEPSCSFARRAQGFVVISGPEKVLQGPVVPEEGAVRPGAEAQFEVQGAGGGD